MMAGRQMLLKLFATTLNAVKKASQRLTLLHLPSERINLRLPGGIRQVPRDAAIDQNLDITLY